MSEKTSINQAIDKLKLEIEAIHIDTFTNRRIKAAYNNAIDILTDLLPTNRKEIEEAYSKGYQKRIIETLENANKGIKNSSTYNDLELRETATEYYTNKYGI